MTRRSIWDQIRVLATILVVASARVNTFAGARAAGAGMAAGGCHPVGLPLDTLRPAGCTDVVPDPAGRGELPLACTLGPADGAERLRRWQRLAAVGAPVARLAGHRLEVRYQPRPGVLAELQSLARAEAGCCAFAEWAVTERDGQPTLVVATEPDAPERVRPIAALFGAT
jgi:hypothetical protein